MLFRQKEWREGKGSNIGDDTSDNRLVAFLRRAGQVLPSQR